MTENEISLEAVNAAIKGSDVFCKFMSANDSGESGAHQVGFLISISAINTLSFRIRAAKVLLPPILLRPDSLPCSDSLPPRIMPPAAVFIQ